ncbi:hypothetical protein VaNZ11_009435 [Volvox africanus]|uniref:Uncharacterized protein n=1 Tax=Volvox africanus TaxID=51714 RepID=A0ABQ5S8Z9_9CHLO|nr:hypothetical protein VaNZ11_009435 [Volvox africanus]
MPSLNTVLGILILSYYCEAHSTLRLGGRDDGLLQRWLHKTRKLAQEGDKGGDISSNSEKLAVIWLLTDFDRKDRDRLSMLSNSLELCFRNLFSSTPGKFYVFTFEEQISFIEQRLGDLMQPNVAVLPVHNSSWMVPQMAADRGRWHSFQNANYRLMGDWRLAFMPHFAKKMGHRYVLQLDDDSFILSPVGTNLVELFDRHGYLLAARNAQRDPPIVTWGLPELARFYLVTNKVVPETLFEFCEPQSIEGLYSEYKRSKLEEGLLPTAQLDRLNQLGLRSRGGWNRTILFGNCLMYSLDWFLQPEVQHFVQLCRTTGASFTYRWNEQGVLAMLWQIFVPRDKLYMFNFDYAHRINATFALQLAERVSGRVGH